MSDTNSSGVNAGESTPTDEEVHTTHSKHASSEHSEHANAEESGSYVDSELDDSVGGETNETEGEYTDVDLDSSSGTA